MNYFLRTTLLLQCITVLRAFAFPFNFDNPPQLVKLRIEGENSTIYEGPIISRGTTITTASGGTNRCDGTNNGANPDPGATPTTALNAASKLLGFDYDGTFSEQFDDYFITSIGDSTQTDSQFWGVLVNFEFIPVGGCQFQTEPKDNVLWAFDAFGKDVFLELEGPRTARKGKPVTVTVTDGMTGEPLSGATIEDQTTNAQGEATFTFASSGVKKLKAERDDAIRSNAIYILVV